MQKEEKPKLIKVILFGETSSGKTSIMKRLTHNEFNQEYRPKIGIEFATMVDPSSKYKFQFWDTAGQVRYKAFAGQVAYYNGSILVIYVFDTSNKATFDAIGNNINRRKTHLGSACVELLIGTKNDLPNRAVTLEEGEDFAQKNNLMYFDMNCTTNQYRLPLIEKLAEMADKYCLNNPS